MTTWEGGPCLNEQLGGYTGVETTNNVKDPRMQRSFNFQKPAGAVSYLCILKYWSG